MYHKCFIVYAESKKELYNAVLHLHKELAEKVKIVIFNPGPTQTPLFTKFWKEIKKLPPANYLEINTLTLEENLHEYWNLSSKNTIVKEDKLIPKINSI